jgi:Outer membrane protein beta-barrel domain
MKKLFLCCAALVLSTAAQPLAAQHVRAGLKAGLNYSNVTSTIGGIKRLLGPAAGAFVQIPLSSDGFFLVQPELLYSAKGSRVQYNLGTYTQRSHYIDVPLLAKITVNGLFFELGPQISFLAAIRNESPYGTFTSTKDSNRFTLGAASGIGYQLPQGLGLTLRYTHDITRIYQYGPRNSVFQLQASMLLPDKN